MRLRVICNSRHSCKTHNNRKKMQRDSCPYPSFLAFYTLVVVVCLAFQPLQPLLYIEPRFVGGRMLSGRQGIEWVGKNERKEKRRKKVKRKESIFWMTIIPFFFFDCTARFLSIHTVAADFWLYFQAICITTTCRFLERMRPSVSYCCEMEKTGNRLPLCILSPFFLIK